MNIKNILLAMIFLCMAMPTQAFFWEERSNAITGTLVSLGNGSCTPFECDNLIISLGMPLGIEKPQYIKLIIYPACFGSQLTDNEAYNLTITCYNGFNTTIDMKEAMCNPAESIIQWIEVRDTNRTTAYYEYEGVFYEAFWCRFKRPVYNVQRLPTEFNLVVDSMGLTNPAEDDVLYKQRVTGSKIMSGIGEIFAINFNVLQIMFYLASAIVIVIGFVILIGGIPIMIKYIFKKTLKR